jgi:glycosyltransferase involved in cell wall biosynthesis
VQVLLLSPEPPSRGILQSLVADGVAPVVARPRGDAETDGLVRYERVTARGDLGDPMDLRWSRKALRTLVRDLRPKLIHIVGDPWTPTAEAGAAAARNLKIPYVLVGTSSLGGPKGMTAKWQAKKVRDGAAGLAGIVRSALDHLQSGGDPVPGAVIPAPGFTIPGAIPARLAPEFPTMAVIGRVVPERGLDLLFNALSDVYGEWRLKIVGTGPSQEELEAHAQKLGLSARIEWLGGLPRAELGSLWNEVDVLVAPSRSSEHWVEPTGSVALEAMSNGIAAVVSRCGALPDVVGEAGMIIDEDDKAALSRALQGLVEEPARCRALGVSARRRVLEEYGDGPIAAKMVGLWREALGDKP